MRLDMTDAVLSTGSSGAAMAGMIPPQISPGFLREIVPPCLVTDRSLAVQLDQERV